MHFIKTHKDTVGDGWSNTKQLEEVYNKLGDKNLEKMYKDFENDF